MKITEVKGEPIRKNIDWSPLYEAAAAKPGTWLEASDTGLHSGTIRNMAKELNRGKRGARVAEANGGYFEATTRTTDGDTALAIRFVKGER